MKKDLTRKITLAGVLLAIVIVFQLLKNISAFISGPVINAVMVIATIELGIWWGLGFCVGVPLLSLLISPAAPTTIMAYETYGVSVAIIVFGNLIFCLLAYFFSKKKIYFFIGALIVGALAKWGFMWGTGTLLLEPLFSESLGPHVVFIEKVFSVLQLYAGLLSVVLIVPLKFLIEKVQKNKR